MIVIFLCGRKAKRRFGSEVAHTHIHTHTHEWSRVQSVKPNGPPDGHWEPWDQTRLNVQKLNSALGCATVCLPQSVQQKKK